MTEATRSSSNITDVAIIGAGPYGLSIAAHLAARGVDFRIFGDPMSAWSKHMPQDMCLKSDGFASSLSDPASEFTLGHYCRQEGIPYEDTGLPVRLETFVAYGLAFQRKFVPNLDDRLVASVEECPAGFELQLEDGERLFARKVIVAAGVIHFARIPENLLELPEEFISHSSAYGDLAGFAGRSVAVVGAGASALDLAASLHDAGATVHVIARKDTIRFHDPPQPRSLVERIRRPSTGLGASMQLFFYVNAPSIFRLLPESLRLDRVRKTLGPAPGWFVKERVVGKVAIHVSTRVTRALVRDGRVNLELENSSGQSTTLEVDRVIAATGYRVDIQRFAFLSGAIRDNIRLVEQSPHLSKDFESSVPGLYFVGLAGANTFGPLLRFAFGARFTAQRLSGHLARLRRGRALVPSQVVGERA
jgi:thioredoxin reductase